MEKGELVGRIRFLEELLSYEVTEAQILRRKDVAELQQREGTLGARFRRDSSGGGKVGEGV
jgi:hypothetical protein